MPYLEKRHHLEHNGRKWIEVEQYFSGMYGNHDTRLPRWKMTSEQVEIINRRRAAKGLRRLILLNFSPGDLYLTFTYRKGVRVTPEEAVKILNRFMERLKYQYNKRGQPFKWIKTTGLTSTGKAHHHVIMNRVEGVPYDKVIAKYFPYGRVCTEYLYEDGEYKQLAESFVSALGTAISGLASVGSTIVSAVGTALSNAASFLTSSVSSVFAGGAASIAAGLFAAIGAAIAGWNIGQLIYNKFSEQIDSIVTTVGDFFTQTIPQALSNANKTIVNLAVNVKGNIDQKAQEVKDWFADKKEQVKNFVAIAKDNASDILNSLKDKWNAIQDKTPKLIANVIDSSNGVLDSLKSKWEAIKDKTPKLIATAEEGKKSALATIKSAWGAIYKKSVKLTASAKNKDSKVLKTIKSAWNSIKDKSAELSVTFRDAFTSKIKAAWNGLAKAINKGIDKINKIPGVNISHIATFATGGFPEEGPFMMNRGEIAGKFSNGKGVVANNMQITTGISKAVGPAVYQATKAAMQVALPSVHTPSLAVSTDHSDKTMEKMLDCLLRMASDGNQDVVVMLKELLKYLKETPRDTYLDGTKITGRVVEIINTMTEVNKKCPIKV